MSTDSKAKSSSVSDGSKGKGSSPMVSLGSVQSGEKETVIGSMATVGGNVASVGATAPAEENAPISIDHLTPNHSVSTLPPLNSPENQRTNTQSSQPVYTDVTHASLYGMSTTSRAKSTMSTDVSDDSMVLADLAENASQKNTIMELSQQTDAPSSASTSTLGKRPNDAETRQEDSQTDNNRRSKNPRKHKSKLKVKDEEEILKHWVSFISVEDVKKLNKTNFEKLIVHAMSHHNLQACKQTKVKYDLESTESFQDSIDENWLMNLVDVKGDGNCLLYSLMFLFPDVTDSIMDRMSPIKGTVGQLIYYLRESIANWAENVITNLSHDDTSKKHIMNASRATCGELEVDEEVQKKNFIKYMAWNALVPFELPKSNNYTNGSTANQIKKRSVPDEDYFLYAFAVLYKKSVVKQTIMKYPKSEDGGLGCQQTVFKPNGDVEIKYLSKGEKLASTGKKTILSFGILQDDNDKTANRHFNFFCSTEAAPSLTETTTTTIDSTLGTAEMDNKTDALPQSEQEKSGGEEDLQGGDDQNDGADGSAEKDAKENNKEKDKPNKENNKEKDALLDTDDEARPGEEESKENTKKRLTKLVVEEKNNNTDKNVPDLSMDTVTVHADLLQSSTNNDPSENSKDEDTEQDADDESLIAATPVQPTHQDQEMDDQEWFNRWEQRETKASSQIRKEVQSKIGKHMCEAMKKVKEDGNEIFSCLLALPTLVPPLILEKDLNNEESNDYDLIYHLRNRLKNWAFSVIENDKISCKWKQYFLKIEEEDGLVIETTIDNKI